MPRRLARSLRRRLLVRAWLRTLFRALEAYRPEPVEDRTIVIDTIRGHGFYFFLALFLAVLLAKQGCRVKLLVDDGVLAHWDTLRRCDADIETVLAHRTKRRNGATRLRNRCRRLIRRYAPELDVGVLFYSELLTGYETVIEDGLRQRQSCLSRGEASNHVLGSHHRFFGGRPFDPNNQEHLTYARLSTENESIGYAVGDALCRETGLDLLLILDGIYTTFGPLAETVRNSGVGVVYHQPAGSLDGYSGERLMAVSGDPYMMVASRERWQAFIDSGRADELSRKALGLIRDRVDRKGSDPDPHTEALLALLAEKRARHGRVIGVFPNLTWDYNLPERDTLFDSFADWLEETVRWALRQDVVLVIREHPQHPDDYSEFDSTIALLNKRFPDLDTLDQVVLIPGTDPANSYAIIRDGVDCSVIYSGTLGLEIPVLERPVVLACKSLLADAGVGYAPATKEDYFKLLASLQHDSADFCSRCPTFRGNAVRAAAFLLIDSLYYCPLMPRRAAPHGRGFDYFESWELDGSKVNPESNPDFAQTLDRILGRAEAPADARAA